MIPALLNADFSGRSKHLEGGGGSCDFQCLQR